MTFSAKTKERKTHKFAINSLKFANLTSAQVCFCNTALGASSTWVKVQHTN